jgi:hypothetical protein
LQWQSSFPEGRVGDVTNHLLLIDWWWLLQRT